MFRAEEDRAKSGLGKTWGMAMMEVRFVHRRLFPYYGSRLGMGVWGVVGGLWIVGFLSCLRMGRKGDCHFLLVVCGDFDGIVVVGMRSRRRVCALP